MSTSAMSMNFDLQDTRTHNNNSKDRNKYREENEGLTGGHNEGD